MGYFDYEYPQHKSLQDRVNMAVRASSLLQCMQLADAVVVDNWRNSFNDYFAAWPDQCYLVDSSSHCLLFRGEFAESMKSIRMRAFTEQLEDYLLFSAQCDAKDTEDIVA
jgi:hypothetical protein